MEVTLAAAVMLVVPFSILAQGMKADYERSATIRQKYAGLALNLTLTPNWFEGGHKFWYVAERPGGKKEHIVVDCRTGRKVVTPEWELPKERTPPLRDNRAGDRPPFPQANAKSPDDAWRAFVREDNVWLRHNASKVETALTTDGKPDDGYNGEFYWSADAKRLVAMKVKAGGNRKVTLVESSPANQVQPRVITYDYLKPGDAIRQPQPHLFDVEAKKEIKLDRALFNNPWSLDRIRWDADSKRFTFLYNQRGHQVVRVIGINAHDGTAKAIINEECKTFFDYSNKLYYRWLNDGHILWMSERNGYNRIYRINGDTGDVVCDLTDPDRIMNTPEVLAIDSSSLVVRNVEMIDDNEMLVRIHGASSRHYGIDYAVFQLKKPSGRVLTQRGDGNHYLQWSPNREYFIRSTFNINQRPQHHLCEANGKYVGNIEDCNIDALKNAGWRGAEPFQLPGRDGNTPIYGYIVRPSNFDPSKKYPVIEHIYAGPHDFHVSHRFQVVPYEQSMAELGFIVVKMDGMGTNWRSKTFHDVSWQNLKDGGFPDRVAVHKQLAAKYPEMDYSRGVGIFGGSAGGQNALAGLLHHGDTYTVGVADCGCHDNRMDKIWWNEAWMGTMGPHYADNSNVTHAHKLKGKLMLIVGEKDNNVDPASTMQVANALIKANKDFDLLVMPGVGHGAAETPYANRRRQDFFVRHLMGVEPRSK